jgi:hypothetical protein
VVILLATGAEDDLMDAIDDDLGGWWQLSQPVVRAATNSVAI